ncbi:hypothetical protein [Nocardiopsis sp. FIRDI 009]|uniref:hypothetical protein n=1 Tax=Nocardiopsis sp. FIRDI 009 TaxID=714197 RepID=UPI000E24381F|nr:hypothetical protein [Nocardiopsis sp. FIRDI 009]
MSEQPPLVASADPEVEHLAAVLRRRREELADAEAVRIGDGAVAHELITRIWVGVEVPGVLCHASADPLRLQAAPGPVTCRRCRARRSGDSGDQVPGQTSLEL